MPRSTQPITIHNDVPRLDRSGAIVDCHEPCLRRFGDRFYLYGTNYRQHSGFTPDNLIVCYSSSDLEHWDFHGPLFPRFDTGLTVAPDVIHDQRSGRYVMWFISGGSYVVATAEHPLGPFEIVTRRAEITGGDARHGDFSLFVDHDQTAYLIATLTFERSPGRAHCIVIERLREDCCGGSGETSAILGSNCEAPVLFRREGLYYALFDTTCCYGPSGTGIQVHTSEHPLGPYRYRGNSNRCPGSDPRSLDSPSTDPGSGRPDCIVAAQQRRVEWLETSGGPLLLWIGDRWGSTPSGRKGDDFTYWCPLRFAADGMIEAISWIDHWSFELISAAPVEAMGP